MLQNLLRISARYARLLSNEAKGLSYVATRRFASLPLAEIADPGRSGKQMWGIGLAAAGLAAPMAFASSKEDRSFIMIKPDGVQRGLVADIIKRFEAKGYKLVGIKVIVPSEALAAKHYDEHNGKPFFPKLVSFLSSGPCVAMVWEGRNIVSYGRTMIGATDPSASAPGTIRGDYGIEMGRNIIHGSDSAESAQKEISLWFSVKELAEYTPSSTPWIYE